MKFSDSEIEKLKNMPAIKHRIKNGDKFTQMPDGTVMIGKDCKVLKCNDGKGYVELYEIFQKCKYLQFGMDIESTETYEEWTTHAWSTIVDENGFEKELCMKKLPGKNKKLWDSLKFNEINVRDGRRVLRENGLIKEQEVEYNDAGKTTVKSEREYYDVGDCFLDSIYGEERSTKSTRVGLLLSELKENRDCIKRENPELNSVIKRIEKNLLNNIEERYLKASFANVKLDAEYYRSKSMKESLIGFIELVRDNFLGHLFFGKEAESLVGERVRI